MANEHSQIVPSMQPTSTVADFKFWCQKVLPLVYDDSISYYEVLGKMVVYLNQVIDNINADTANVAELEDDFLLLQTYVNNFFDDIDQLVTYTERAEAAQTAAAASAISAATSASNSASSASNSAGSASSAATSALSALDAKDAAVAAKTAAETALASAQTAATNAAASATAASGSATSASGSATNAAASATAAQQSFTLADAARVSAQSAAETCEDVLDSIPEDYTDLSNDVSNLKAEFFYSGVPFVYHTIKKSQNTGRGRTIIANGNRITVQDNINSQDSFKATLSGTGDITVQGITQNTFSEDDIIPLNVPSNVDVYFIACADKLGSGEAFRFYYGTSLEDMTAGADTPMFNTTTYICYKIPSAFIEAGKLIIVLTSPQAIQNTVRNYIVNLVAYPKTT